MNKIDRVINIIRKLKEETGGMTTGSSGAIPGFSEKSPAEGPTSGTSPKLGGMRRRATYASGGYNSRKLWLDYLNNKKR
jgi:hypothetical protein